LVLVLLFVGAAPDVRGDFPGVSHTWSTTSDILIKQDSRLQAVHGHLSAYRGAV
jgi:hypothetical protein